VHKSNTQKPQASIYVLDNAFTKMKAISEHWTLQLERLDAFKKSEIMHNPLDLEKRLKGVKPFSETKPSMQRSDTDPIL
jgi:hypothetical protein